MYYVNRRFSPICSKGKTASGVKLHDNFQGQGKDENPQIFAEKYITEISVVLSHLFLIKTSSGNIFDHNRG